MSGLTILGGIIVLACIIGMLGAYLYGLAADRRDRSGAHAEVHGAAKAHSRSYLSDESSSAAA